MLAYLVEGTQISQSIYNFEEENYTVSELFLFFLTDVARVPRGVHMYL